MTVVRTEDAMVGRKLKDQRGYVFVTMPPVNSIKHLFGGEQPQTDDRTVCGQKIPANYVWAQDARALRGDYCRECERIWKESK